MGEEGSITCEYSAGSAMLKREPRTRCSCTAVYLVGRARTPGAKVVCRCHLADETGDAACVVMLADQPELQGYALERQELVRQLDTINALAGTPEYDHEEYGRTVQAIDQKTQLMRVPLENPA